MKVKLITMTLLVIALSAFFQCVNRGKGQVEKTTEVRFFVEIYDVSLTTDIAQINVTITLSNLNVSGLIASEPVRAVISGDIDTLEILCNRKEGDFVGSSGLVSWSLGGEMGKGEYFPFERYEVRLRLANVLPLSPNMSTIKIRNLDSFAYVVGPRKVVLSHIFKTEITNVGLLVEDYKPQNTLNFTAYLSRRVSDNLLWLLVAPTIACYCMLFATLLLSGEKALRNRLTAYVSIFVFASTFLMTIQGYLPLRVSLSIPEVLIENLIISTVIFAILSFVKVRTGVQEIARDGSTALFSLFFFSYVTNHFLPLFPRAAQPLFLIALLPIVLAVFGLLFNRCLGLAGKPSSEILLFILSFAGIAALALGLFLLAYYLGAYFALYDVSFVYSVALGTSFVAAGSVLVLCWRHLRKGRHYKQLGYIV